MRTTITNVSKKTVKDLREYVVKRYDANFTIFETAKKTYNVIVYINKGSNGIYDHEALECDLKTEVGAARRAVKYIETH